MASGNNILQLLTSILSDINEDFKTFQPLKILSAHKIKPYMIVLPMIIFTVFASALAPSIGHQLVTIYGFLYPSYLAFQALNSQNSIDIKKWMTYWIIFGFLTIFDKPLQFILFFVPAFYSCKALYLTWLFYPRTHGIENLYQNVLKPYWNIIKKVFITFVTKMKQKGI